MNRNYQKELEKIIEENQKQGKIPRLFLHSCCAVSYTHLTLPTTSRV